MAATELSRATGRTRLTLATARPWLAAYAALWAATLASAALVALAPSALRARVRAALALALTPAQNPPPTAGRILALSAHNIPIAAWPLLLGLITAGSEAHARRAGDWLVRFAVLANTLPVGAALGAYRTALIAYIPQLPIEWAALAVGYGSWQVQKAHALSGRGRLSSLLLVGALMLLAALVESCGTPHR